MYNRLSDRESIVLLRRVYARLVEQHKTTTDPWPLYGAICIVLSKIESLVLR